tara:strand:- start:481 stop:1653 length:1173 start_codon:yes stop_codon:yes gene_type:complete
MVGPRRPGDPDVSTRLTWKMGFEIELMAPPGLTRADLAQAVAARGGGTVRRFFHPQSEPSKVPGSPVFENLTPGFEAVDAGGQRLAAFVDDLTLQAGLDRTRPPLDGWHRIVTDDGRLLRLVIRHCDPTADADTVLEPLAALFGSAVQRHDAGMARVEDDRGVSVALCAPLPGERERPCEIVTAPITSGHRRLLRDLLAQARDLGFTLPAEGATHIHFDAEALCDAATLARLVTVLHRHGPGLRRLVGTNPACIRLGAWPDDLMRLVADPGFLAMDWPMARAALAELSLIKYCDFNLSNLIAGTKDKHTFEVRILPATLEAEAVIAAAALFQAILIWCRDGAVGSRCPASLLELVVQLPLSAADQALWLGRVAGGSVALPGWDNRETLIA